MKTVNLKDLMTIREASAILDRSVQRIHQLVREKRIKGKKLAPGLWMVEITSVEEYLKEIKKEVLNEKPGTDA